MWKLVTRWGVRALDHTDIPPNIWQYESNTPCTSNDCGAVSKALGLYNASSSSSYTILGVLLQPLGFAI